jgi:hypothetical protein
MSIIRAIFWIALFVASTFCFIVIFEHGFSNFGENSRKEFKSLKLIFGLAEKQSKENAIPK